jgi:Cellulase (glycosyl hydrolase family 5)
MIRPALVLVCATLLSLASSQAQAEGSAPAMERIRVGPKHREFVGSVSGAVFHPWGFNYDHDRTGRLLEDYWLAEWDTVVADFAEMKALGANTVRIHLQVGKFMKSEQQTDVQSLQQLSRLIALAETNRLYLDITGLGCYKKEDVPRWYNDLDEKRRWDVQARFWEAVARTCQKSPAVFCYDLMNEPVVTEDKTGRDWTPGAFGDRYYVQRLTLDFAGRKPKNIARAWVDKMVGAIRRHDRHRLVTVGVITWALTWPGAQPLFYSKQVSRKLDFVSVHFYPKKGEVDKALKALAVYDIGKPLVIEEMFPLSCPMAELGEFIHRSRSIATGWLGFYWGETIDEYQHRPRSIGDTMALEWLEYFRKTAPAMTARKP